MDVPSSVRLARHKLEEPEEGIHLGVHVDTANVPASCYGEIEVSLLGCLFRTCISVLRFSSIPGGLFLTEILSGLGAVLSEN